MLRCVCHLRTEPRARRGALYVYKNAAVIPLHFLEATPRFELGHRGFADLCLTTWLCRRMLANFVNRCVAARSLFAYVLYVRALTAHSRALRFAKLSAHTVLAGVAGFEPATDGVRVRCLTAWRYPNDVMLIGKNGVGGGIRTHACRNHNPMS